MMRCRFLLALAVVGLLVAGFVAAQDAKKDDPKKDDTKIVVVPRHQLPANYKQLGLSDDQRKQIAKVQNDFGGKIEELQAQINKLKKEEKEAMEKVLTDDQRKRLLDILKEKSGATEKSSEAKPSEK
jgi:Spy/CpxP family protein refolding chaperone